MTLTDRFAANLRLHRKARGMTQATLAALATVASSYVSMLEKGQRIPPLDTIETFARVLNMDPLDLLRN